MESLAGMIEMYRKLEVPDDAKVIEAMRAPVREILKNASLWGADISRLADAVEALIAEEQGANA